MKRRDFIKASLGAVFLSGVSSIPMPLMAGEKTFIGHKSLVCIFLLGGHDGFNLLLPADGSAYTTYQNTRQNMALSQSEILGISPISSQGFNVGLNSQLPYLKTLFEQKELALIANVGTLIKPINKAQFKDKSVPTPEQLFSHNSQQKQWQVLNPELPKGAGWAGRMVDQMNLSGSVIPSAINFTDFTHWLIGENSKPFNMRSSGLIQYTGMKNSESKSESKRKEIFQRILKRNSQHLFENAYAEIQNQAIEVSETIGEALNTLPEIITPYPEKNSLGQQLLSVAKMIAIQEQLNMPRQIFYVKAGGYDTHDKQVDRLKELFKELNDAIESFHKTLQELNLSQKVVTFAASDFGRTLTSNGDGTDHGWGNHLFAFGKDVAGGDIYGTMPELVVDGVDDSRNGRIIPTLSADQYANSLIQWFGFNSMETKTLLPNLKNFSTDKIPFIK